MSARIFAGIFLLLSLLACEKKTETTTPEVKSDYFPLSTGNYWVYNTYCIDSFGNDSLYTENDTVRIIGDTIINGNSYKVFRANKDDLFAYFANRFYRDSSGYIVDNYGRTIFSSDDLKDTLYVRHDADYGYADSLSYYGIMEKYQGQVQTSAGSFDNVLNMRLDVADKDNNLIRSNNYLYAPIVGKILFQYFYVNEYQMKNVYYEVRLVSYQVPIQDGINNN